ncbi:MAG: AraC family transcriptional regulator ligand-binding domain-containing protein [Proteobacteria bacterium]|nr:AraC family transcriptional regulator ligand-binding domain-containing protein [Pseudomonadota bacterium]
MARWVRGGVLEGADGLVAELGGSFAALARAAGLPARVLARPDLPVRVEAVTRFLDLAAARLGEESFGLRLGLGQSLALFGPLRDLLASAPTVGGMLRDLAAFFPLHTQGTLVTLAPAPDGLLLTYELASGAGRDQRQVIELGFGVMLAELRRHAPGWMPLGLQLRHAAPADPRWHRRVLGPGVLYNADRNAMLCDAALLARPLAEGDAAVHDPLAARFGAVARQARGLEAARTEALVRAMLPFAPPDIAQAARLLRLSRRTLQRRLAAEGTAFATLLDQTRASLARTYLRESALKVGEITEILGYCETSALSRAVRRWYGLSPRALRRAGPGRTEI